MREQFESIPEISERLKFGDVKWNEDTQSYKHTGGTYRRATFVNGAWAIYKEQEKRIGLLEKRNKVLIGALYVKTDAYYFNEIMQEIGAIK